MKIKACKENEEVIQSILDNVNGNASAHTFNSAKQLIDMVIKECFEGEVYCILGTACDMPGAQFHCTSSGSVCNAYKYSRKGTRIVFTRGSKEWFITDISKTLLYPNQGGHIKLYLTEKQRDLAHKNLSRKFQIIEEQKKVIKPNDEENEINLQKTTNSTQ